MKVSGFHLDRTGTKSHLFFDSAFIVSLNGNAFFCYWIKCSLQYLFGFLECLLLAFLDISVMKFIGGLKSLNTTISIYSALKT